jgi:hypothetical protein
LPFGNTNQGRAQQCEKVKEKGIVNFMAPFATSTIKKEIS